MGTMKVVYVAGPFRGSTAWDIEQNIRRAEEVGIQVALLGAAPLIPHSNSRYFHGTCTEEFWLEATMALLRKADAVMLVSDWKRSLGTLAELNEATRIGLPAFGNLSDLEGWIRSHA